MDIGLDDSRPFIWKKKFEELGIKDEKQMLEETLKQIERNKEELKRIEERQRKKELERQQILDDSEFLQRQKDAERHRHWELNEKDFDLKQHIQRSRIRIRDGRAKAIDFFSHYIDVFSSDDDNCKKEYSFGEEQMDLSETLLCNPCDWFNGLKQSELSELIRDIREYMLADKYNKNFWEDLLMIAENEMNKLIAAINETETDGISSSVLSDVMALFQGKTIGQLNQQEDEIIEMLDSGGDEDYTFYKSVLSRLRAHRARVRLETNHKVNLRQLKDKILTSVKQENVEDVKTDINLEEHALDETLKEDEFKQDIEQEEQDDLDPFSNDFDSLAPKFRQDRLECIKAYEAGCYTPPKLEAAEIDPLEEFNNFEVDYNLLKEQREIIRNASSLHEANIATMSKAEQNFMDIATKDLDWNVESEFKCEDIIMENLPSASNNPLHQAYSWANKYKPRKPRYFNRVHTGFEWHKYNQTHYDIDNPPPKIVQGYKFNMFYPDLIDRTKTPSFTITPCKDDKDFCIIRFTAGPPYEDVAFKIVNREWNNSHKSGYRCQFMNNILQLWFHFKRFRYRR